MDEEEAIKVLTQVKRILDKYGVEYWLDCGTLLGAVRDGKFIPWDSDIDLGTWDNQISRLYNTSKELRDNGLKVGIWEWEGRVSISGENCGIDFYLYHLVDDKAITKWLIHGYKKNIMGQILDYLHRIISEQRCVIENSHMPAFVTKILYKIVSRLPSHLRERLARIIWLLYKKTGCVVYLSIPSHYFKNLSVIKFYGMEFKVPAETEKYLAYRYGENWRVPKKDYIHYEEDGAIC